ncbi:hypothetical protein MPSEU_000941900 [Mayamaea pseudoterrestris]|nr:hypothetical protein MPSEU_000941900 [Mayamaea pseudoterrestris]
MGLTKAVRQTPGLARIFAPQPDQHHPLLTPKHSDYNLSPSASFDPEINTDFLLDSPPRSPNVPFFFNVRDDIDTDERLDPSSDSVRRESALQLSYDFSLLGPAKTFDFDSLFELNKRMDENHALEQSMTRNGCNKEELALTNIAERSIVAAPSMAVPEPKLVEKEPSKSFSEAVEGELEETTIAETTDATIAIAADAIELPMNSAPPTPKRTNVRPALTIITNPDDYYSKDSDTKPPSCNKPVSSRSFHTEAVTPSCQIKEAHLVTESATASFDEPSTWELAIDDNLQKDKENGEEDIVCLLAPNKRTSVSSDGLLEHDGLEASPRLHSRFRIPGLKLNKEARASSAGSTPGERYDALISKLGSEQKRVDNMHAKLRSRVKVSSSDSEEKSEVDTNSLGAKTNEKNMANDPVLVFEPPQPNEILSSPSPKTTPQGYEQLASPTTGYSASIPEWARSGYLQRSRQQRLNRFRKANQNKPGTPVAANTDSRFHEAKMNQTSTPTAASKSDNSIRKASKSKRSTPVAASMDSRIKAAAKARRTHVRITIT